MREKTPIDLRHSESALSFSQADPSRVTSPTTAAGLYVSRHFNINPAIADLVAALAGFPDRRPA